MEIKRPKIAKIVLRVKHKCGELTVPNFQAEYETKVIRTVWYWCEVRY